MEEASFQITVFLRCNNTFSLNSMAAWMTQNFTVHMPVFST